MVVISGYHKGGVFYPAYDVTGASGYKFEQIRPYGFTSHAPDSTVAVAHLAGDHAFTFGEQDVTAPSTPKGGWILYDGWGTTIESDALVDGLEIKHGVTGATITLTTEAITITQGTTVISVQPSTLEIDSANITIHGGGTWLELTGGNVYLGCQKDDTNPNIKQVLLSGGTAKNVYAEKS